MVLRDIETEEEIIQDNFVFIINQDGKGIAMNHHTFMNQLELNKEYCKNYPGDATVDQFYADYVPCTYEIRDDEEKILRTKDGAGREILHQYPFYIPKKGLGFKKTLEYFLNLEKILIN